MDENALSVTVKRLRDKLEDNPSPPDISRPSTESAIPGRMSGLEVCKEVHMDKYMVLCMVSAVTALVLAVCMVMEKRQMHRHLNQLDQMLEAAIDGNFGGAFVLMKAVFPPLR